jgi:hypothetical protein
MPRLLRYTAFVLMQYYGYLHCDPDAAPVKAFINSDEYRRRFGP